MVDRLTKSTHFLLGKSTYSVDKWAQLYLKEVTRLYGVPVSIVSDRDPRFTSKFWKSLRKALGMAPFEALYGKKCRSPVCWDEMGERKLLGLDLVQATNEAI